MRISTSWSQQVGVNAMLDQQSKLSELQMQLSAQKKILKPSDDPAGAARIIDLNQGIKQTEQYQSNINTASQRLSLEDGVLQDAVDAIQRVKELGIQGLNDTNSQSDRAAIATELDGLSQHLLGLANTKNANGEYLFSGFKSNTQPFNQIAGGGYNYAGDLNQRAIQIGTDRQISDGDAGVTIFGTPTGALSAAGSNTNVFEAIDKLAADLRNNTPNASSLDDISSSLDKILTAQSSVGVRLNALDRQDGLNSDSVLELKTVLSQTEDLDFADAVSKFNLQTISLQAAQQAFSRVEKLSLFNYL
ncbi:MAG: flagellar hook-associated protein FlgL [Methylobacter sp.]|nr:flagellar hook-associated protein FlgL [Methylobacter sp.]